MCLCQTMSVPVSVPRARCPVPRTPCPVPRAPCPVPLPVYLKSSILRQVFPWRAFNSLAPDLYTLHMILLSTLISRKHTWRLDWPNFKVEKGLTGLLLKRWLSGAFYTKVSATFFRVLCCRPIVFNYQRVTPPF